MPSNQSLEAEMDQVMQSLGKFGTGLTSFWGDLRKQVGLAFAPSLLSSKLIPLLSIQGSTAYAASLKRAEAARKDLAPYMDQAKPYMDSAKAELAKTREEMAKLGKELNKSPEQLQAERGSDAALETTPTPSFYGEVLQPGDAISNTQVGPSAPMLEVNLPNPSAFFDKLQSQIASNPNLASLQANLKENFSRVGPMASTGGKMAEAYLHKGEEYIKHAGKDLETFLNQAVRIVPGEESSSGTSPPSSSSAGPATDTKGKSNSSAQMIQLAGRKEQLLHRLATNQAIFLIDPTEPLDPSSTTVTSTSGSASEATKETFDAFMHDVQGQGGFDSPQWQERIQATLADPKMAPLKSTMDSLGKVSRSKIIGTFAK